jgi:aryl-alcohol dehydrogenase-like predicted oxidoreductase
MNFTHLSIGSAQFGLQYGITNVRGKVPIEEIQSILNSARHFGVNSIDTAISYGNAEERLGCSDLSTFSVVTKLPPYNNRSDAVDWVTTHIENSIKRLRSKPAAVLLHRPSDLLGSNGQKIVDALHRAQSEGLIGGVGVSVYQPADLDAVAGRLNWTDVQVPMNVCDRRMIESGWLVRLVDEGVRVHVRSAFLQGLLLQQSKELPAGFEQWRPLWTRWTAWLDDQSLSPLTACLGFILTVPQVHRIIVGIDSLEHWNGLLKAFPEKAINIPDWMAVGDNYLIDPTSWSVRS